MARWVKAAFLALLAGGVSQACQDLDRDSSLLIDRHLAALWKKEGLRPAARAGDQEFLRRLCIDLVGEVPAPEEIRQFMASDRPDKRFAKVDELLQSPWFARSWGERMTNYLLGYPRQFDYFTDRKGFLKWIQERLKDPEARLDAIARDILTASSEGDNTSATGFFSQFAEFDGRRFALKIEQVTGRASTAFLGIRLQCAQCHDHPADRWTQEDFAGMAAFFCKTGFSQQDFRYGVVDREKPLSYAIENLKVPLVPRFLDDSEPRSEQWRAEFARFLTASPRFARAFVNRAWAWLFGKGIVDPLDDMTDARKPVAPELLDALARDFAAHKFDLRHLVRSICNSDAYHLTSKRADGDDERAERFFGRARIRPLTPEQLFESISRQTDLVDADRSLNDDAILDLLGGQNMTGEAKKYFVVRRWFIDMLVKTSDEAATTNFSAYTANVQQVLYALNKDLPLFTGAKGDTGGRLQKLLEARKKEKPDERERSLKDEEILEEIYLSTLSRSPSWRERARCLEHVKKADDRRKGFEEIYWALLNTDEFIFNH